MRRINRALKQSKAVNRWLQNDIHLILALFLLALALRVVVAMALPPTYFIPDEDDYVKVADNLVQTRTLGHRPGIPDAVWPPIYPLFLASLYVVWGHTMLAVRLAQALVDALTCVIVFFIARKIYDRKVASLSSLSWALYPVAIVWTGFHLPETVYLFWVALFFWCLVRSFNSRAFSDIFLAGATFALTVLMRELLVLFPLFIFAALVWAKFKWKQVGKYVAIFPLGAAVALSPWVVRNYLSLHRFVLVTDRVSEIPYNVQYKLTGSRYVPSSHLETFQRRERRRPLEDVLSGARSLNDTDHKEVLNLDFMTQYPSMYLKMMYVRFQTLWFHPDGLDRLPGWPLKAAYVLGHLIFLGLGCFGMFLAIRERNKLTYPLILVFPYVTAVVLIWFRPQPRYKMPFLPYMFIFAVSGLFSVTSHLRQERPPAIGGEADR